MGQNLWHAVSQSFASMCRNTYSMCWECRPPIHTNLQILYSGSTVPCRGSVCGTHRPSIYTKSQLLCAGCTMQGHGRMKIGAFCVVGFPSPSPAPSASLFNRCAGNTAHPLSPDLSCCTPGAQCLAMEGLELGKLCTIAPTSPTVSPPHICAPLYPRCTGDVAHPSTPVMSCCTLGAQCLAMDGWNETSSASSLHPARLCLLIIFVLQRTNDVPETVLIHSMKRSPDEQSLAMDGWKWVRIGVTSANSPTPSRTPKTFRTRPTSPIRNSASKKQSHVTARRSVVF
jgi:hypothetical protein